MKFYYVYVLKSRTRGYVYVGFTSDLKQRLKEHNHREVISTKRYAPLDLIFYEAYLSTKDAKRRELYLKTTKGRTVLRTMLQDTLK